QQIPAALAGSPGAPVATLVAAQRFVYVEDVTGTLTPQVLLRRGEEAFIADSVLTTVLAGQPIAANNQLSGFMQQQGGYRLDVDGLWWNPSLEDEFAAASAFYVPLRTTDPFARSGGPRAGTIVDYTYDAHSLLLVKTQLSSSGGDVLPQSTQA